MKNIILLKEAENSSMKLKEEIEFSEYIRTDKDKQFNVDNHRHLQELKIFRDKSDVELICKEIIINQSKQQHSWSNETIITNNQELKDFILIEQLYTPIKKLLEIELKLRNKELENTKKFLEYLNLKFSSYLMIDELTKTS